MGASTSRPSPGRRSQCLSTVGRLDYKNNSPDSRSQGDIQPYRENQFSFAADMSTMPRRYSNATTAAEGSACITVDESSRKLRHADRGSRNTCKHAQSFVIEFMCDRNSKILALWRCTLGALQLRSHDGYTIFLIGHREV